MIRHTVQDTARDVLVKATSHIRDENTAGYVFGVALVLTDHIFNILGGFK